QRRRLHPGQRSGPPRHRNDRRRDLRGFARARWRLAHRRAIERDVSRQVHRIDPARDRPAGGAIKKSAPWGRRALLGGVGRGTQVLGTQVLGTQVQGGWGTQRITVVSPWVMAMGLLALTAGPEAWMRPVSNDVV